MKNDMQRRLFFKRMASTVSGFIDTIISPDHDGLERQTQMTSEIMGDLTPELLAMEARRLGLDPLKDHHRVCQTIQAAMSRSGTKDSSMD